VDPLTKLTSLPGETAEEFGVRVQASAAFGKARRKVEDATEKKRRRLAAREQDLSGRRTEKWVAIGSAILSNIGIFRGRKRRITGAGAVLSKNRMENAAEARVAALQEELAELEAERASLDGTSRFEERLVVPARRDVKILRYDLVWVY
jgi:hypothetical protein